MPDSTWPVLSTAVQPRTTRTKFTEPWPSLALLLLRFDYVHVIQVALFGERAHKVGLYLLYFDSKARLEAVRRGPWVK